MPKVEIDYSNTIIYKIACKNSSVKDVYVGHTTNFVQRKYAHKQTCNNSKSPCYNLKLYKTIRENGNWYNWDMTIINFYNCKNHLEARQKEQEYYVLLEATLNSIEPLPSNIIHDSPNKISSKIVNNLLNTKYECKLCKYYTNKKCNYDQHILSLKHIKSVTRNTISSQAINIPMITKKFICNNCGHNYDSKSGLWKHVSKCSKVNHSNSVNDITQLTNMVIKLTEQNQELSKKLSDMSKNIQNIFEWQKRNPEYRDPESKQNDRYNKLICETMSGSSTEEQLKNYEKIVSNVVKEVVIDKL